MKKFLINMILNRWMPDVLGAIGDYMKNWMDDPNDKTDDKVIGDAVEGLENLTAYYIKKKVG